MAYAGRPNQAQGVVALDINAEITENFLAAGIDATKLADGTVSNTEFEALDGLTGNVQAQLDSKVSLTGAQTIAGAKTFSSNIIGNLTGNADTATSATTVATTAATANSTFYPAFVGANTTGNQAVQVDSAGALSYNPSTGVLSATSFNGALSGTANRATNLAGGAANQLAYQTAPNTTGFLSTANSGVLVTDASGVPSISTTLPAVNGAALTSLNASNISSGTVASARLPVSTSAVLGAASPDNDTITAAAGVYSVAKVPTGAASSNATFYPTFVAGNTASNQAVQVDSAGALAYNPSTGTLSATAFSGALSGTASSATNLAGGAANQIAYQTATGVTGFISTANNGVLVTDASGVPSISNTLPAVSGAALTSLNASNISSGTVDSARLPVATSVVLGASSPDNDTITAASGVYSVAKVPTTASTTNTAYYPTFVSAGTTSTQSLVVDGNTAFSYNPSTGTVTATTFNGALSGVANKATNVDGGATNQIPYQTGANSTGFISAANNAVLVSNGSGVPSMSATLPAVNGAAVTNLNASNISSGTIGSAYLPAATTAALGAVRYDNVTIGLNGSNQLELTGTYNSQTIATTNQLVGQTVLTYDPTNNVTTDTVKADTALTNMYNYIQTTLSGQTWKQACLAASTGNVNLASAPSSFDGVSALVSGASRIFVGLQTAPAENGVYIWNGTGSAMTRSSDLDVWAEFQGATITVSQGTTYGGTIWICTVGATGTLGTTPITFSAISSGGAYLAGTNMSLTGNVFSTVLAPSFNSVALNNNTNQLVLGTGSTTTVTMAALSGSRTFTLPDANSNSVRPLSSATANNWVQYIDSTGTQQLAQPAFSNISGVATSAQLPVATSAVLGASSPDNSTITAATGVYSVARVPTAQVSNNTDYYPLLAGANTASNQVVDVDGTGALKYNPSTGTLSSTTFSGALTGVAAQATNINGGAANQIPYQTAAGATSFISAANSAVLVSDGSGVPSMSTTLPAVSGAALTSLNASNISSGTVASARLPVSTAATLGAASPDNDTITATSGVYSVAKVPTTAASSNTTFYPTFVAANTASNQAVQVDNAGALSYNPSTGTLSATSFNGALSGTANKATNVAGGAANQIVYQTAVDTTSFISTANNGVLVTNASGVPSISTTLPAVNGSALTSLNASNISSGTVASARLPVATSAVLGASSPDNDTITATAGVYNVAKVPTVQVSNNATYYPLLAGANTASNQAVDVDGTGVLKYNPSTGTFTASIFSGNIAGGAAGQAVVQTAANTTSFLSYTPSSTASTLVSRDASVNFAANAVVQGYATTATSGTAVTLTVTSAPTQNFTGSTAQTVLLPAANTLYLYQTYTIINASTAALTLQDSAGGAVATVPVGYMVLATCTNIGSAAGAWNATVVLTTTAALATNTTVGLVKSDNGVTTTVSGTGAISTAITMATASATGAIPAGQRWTTVGANSVALTLPALSTVAADGMFFYVKNLNFTGCTLVANGTDDIDGSTQIVTLNPFDSIQLCADKTAGTWYIF